MGMNAHTDLLRQIERFISDTGTTPTRFGKDAANDPTLVFDLRKGRELRRATEAKVRGFIQRQILQTERRSA
jgi:hypothetical protein